jgi:1-acyl-sn-glycerol-3-phosphate acyltransferase
MLPIYRQRDGVENLEKNQQVFQRTNKLLANNKNILIFGEGFTSDQIQRRLHPLKKGAARIGFSALQACAWSKTIYLEGIGLNYTDFNSRGSEVLLLSGQRICLNDLCGNQVT